MGSVSISISQNFNIVKYRFLECEKLSKETNFVCPKCGGKETQVKIDPNTGQVLLICANKKCQSLRSKGWM
jgi:ubiquitin C-terminal hydrolase